MPPTRDEVLATARQSLSAAGAHDRDGWLGLFADDAALEDPVGSAPHRGRAAIARFYDTFIGPRDIGHDVDTARDRDIVVGTTVLRDVDLRIGMTPSVVLTVPTYIRYDIRAGQDRLAVAALSAYWELPAMLRQFLRAGPAAVPAGVGLGRTMAGRQGVAGVLGFATGVRGTGSGAKPVVTRFLDRACAGDEIGGRRLLAAAEVTAGDTATLTASELIRELAGGQVDKVIRSGRAVAARIVHPDRRSVLICDTRAGVGRDRAHLRRVRIFGEPR